MFMVLSSWQSHCESSLGSLNECRTVLSSRRPKTKPDVRLRLWVRLCRLQESTPTITIHYYYSARKLRLIYRPTEGRRLSRPIIVQHQIARSWYTGRWRVGCYIWYSEPAQAPPRCTKCNSPPINGQCTNHGIAVQWSVALRFSCGNKGLKHTVYDTYNILDKFFTYNDKNVCLILPVWRSSNSSFKSW